MSIHEFLNIRGLGRDHIPLMYDKILKAFLKWEAELEKQRLIIDCEYEDLIDSSMENIHDILVPVVCDKYGIKLFDFYSDIRKRKFVDARIMVTYILRMYYRYSTIRIGEIFDKNHSTICHYTKKFPDLMETDPTFGLTYRSVIKEFNKKLIILHDKDTECQVKTLLSSPDMPEEMPKPLQMEKLPGLTLHQVNAINRAMNGRAKQPG